MRRRVYGLWVALVLMGAAALSTADVLAQQGGSSTLQEEKSAEFTSLWQRLAQTDKPEELVALAESALRLEQELSQWPHASPREETRAKLSWFLGMGLVGWSQGSRADNIERAIASYEAALTYFTRDRSIKDWASLQNNLANAFIRRMHGSKADNLEAAINASEAALTFLTREDFPQQWAMAQNNRARAYRERIRGSRADNLEVAIQAYEATLRVRTREDFPQMWASTLHNLANAYRDRIRGSKADNLEIAIKAYEASLTVSTRQDFPVQWSATQNGLAIAYRNRIRGAKADNLEAAIKAYEASLSVNTRQTSPQEWAATQNNLANAYRERIHGTKADNIEFAIKAYEEAFTVYTREAFPEYWADAQNNLAVAYRDRVRGVRRNNLEAAIRAYEEALTVFTREAFPQKWAGTQHNLATAYHDRIHGAKADNLEAAIKAYEAALTIRTRETFPEQWAQTQDALAITYRSRIRGSNTDNLEAAIKALEAALTVFTREAFPRDHLRSSSRLAQIFLEKRDWRAASTQYANARAAFLLLFGQGLDEAEAQDLIGAAGPLFAEAAYAAAEVSDAEGAFNLLGEGKARQIAVTLRQQSLDLPVEKRARLAALQSEIREWRPVAESAPGEEGARALEKLIAARRELGDLFTIAIPKDDGGGALAAARTLVPEGGALLAPIVTQVGGKMLLLRSQIDGQKLSIVDMPSLNSARLAEVMRGPADDPNTTGWLGAFNIQYLPPDERAAHWPKWIAAIGGIGDDLWGLVGEAAQQALVENGIKPDARIIWMPTGALGLLPIGMAQEAPGKPRLADLYEMVSAPSLEAMAAALQVARKQVAPSLAVVVNPTGDLPFTETESALLSAHFQPQAQVKLDKNNAEPALVLAGLKGKSYWHFSSHGGFNWSDARQSGLYMKGGQLLTVQSLLDEQTPLGRPRLVVLSACETGLYDIDRNPDEFVGLPATFIQLGAAGVVGTLWQVDDLATSLLVARFYDLHLGQGLPPPAALREAQRWLRSSSKSELIAYASSAAAKAKLEPQQLAALERQLKYRTRGDHPRFAATWKLLQETAEAAAKALGKAWNDDEILKSRPFEHPYYWGAFVYTGL